MSTPVRKPPAPTPAQPHRIRWNRVWWLAVILVIVGGFAIHLFSVDKNDTSKGDFSARAIVACRDQVRGQVQSPKFTDETASLESDNGSSKTYQVNGIALVGTSKIYFSCTSTADADGGTATLTKLSR